MTHINKYVFLLLLLWQSQQCCIAQISSETWFNNYLLDANPLLVQATDALDSSNYDLSIELLREAQVVLREKEDHQGLALAYYFEGKCHIHKFDLPATHTAFDSSLQISRTYQLPVVRALTFNALQIVYEFQSNYILSAAMADSVLEEKNIPFDVTGDAYVGKARVFYEFDMKDSTHKYLNLAYKLDVKYQDTNSLVFTSTDLGKFHKDNGQLDSALHYYLYSAELEQANREHDRIGNVYMYIAGLFINMENYYKAREYANLALSNTDETNQKSVYYHIIALIGLLDEIDGNYESAINHYTSSSNFFNIRNSVKSWTTSQLGLANALAETGKIDEARSIVNEVKTKLDSKPLNANYLKLRLAEAKIYLVDQQYAKAIEVLDSANEEIPAVQTLYIKRSIHKLYSEAYEKQGKNLEALSHLKLYHNYDDSINSKTQSFIIHDLESKYQKSIKEKEITQLQSEKGKLDLLLDRRERTIRVGIIFLLFSLIFFGVIYTMYAKIKHKNQIISNSLTEKNTLLKEIHHRVKNNLQIISSLLSLQSRSTKEKFAVRALQESQTRVRSMALIHQNLYQHEHMVKVDVKDYITNLSHELLRTYKQSDQNIDLQLFIDDLLLDLDTIIPMGLVMNELITNSIKYAFPDGRDGRILIKIAEQPKRLIFEIKDGGIGLPSGFNIEKCNTLGFRLVKSFCKKMDADFKILDGPGTHIKLTIPYDNSKI